jgi:hypothetical protein
MTISWSKDRLIVLAPTEADVEALAGVGYHAILIPGPDELEPLPKAEHYLVAAREGAHAAAVELAKSGVCCEWQVSVAHILDYPDFTHALAEGGEALVHNIVRSGKSLYADEERVFIDVHRPEAVASYLTGWDFLKPYVRWTLPEFVVFVGPYAGGKSALAQLLAADFADVAGRELGATASICAWEDADWRVRRNLERFATTREELNPTKGPEHRIVDLLRRVRHITRKPGELRTIDWYLERAELQVKRYNTRFFVFDPWNEHDQLKERNDNETEYVNKMLREMREFTAVHRVIMCVVTHVSSKSFTDEGKVKPFRLANAHGSSHFGKKSDRGLCVARTRALAAGENRMIIRFDKAKDEESMGDIGDIAVAFDRDRMDLAYDSSATMELCNMEGWGL